MIRRWLLSTVVAGGFAVVASSSWAAGTLQPDSNWAISKIAANQIGGDAYCALARRFNNGLILTLARNGKDEGSIAIDFQKDVLNSAVEYPVTITPNTGAARSFNVHPVSGKAVVIRLGADYAFYDSLNRSSVLGINVAGTQYDFAVSDFPQGQEKLNGCLSTMVEPAAGPVAAAVPPPAATAPQSVPFTPVSVPVEPVIAEQAPPPVLTLKKKPVPQAALAQIASAPMQPIAPLSGGDVDAIVRDQTSGLVSQIDSLRNENARLQQIAEGQRRDFEEKLKQQSTDSAEAAKIQDRVMALENENSTLRQQVESALANATPVAPPTQLTQESCPAPDKTAENILNAELERLRQENLRLNQDIVLSKARITSLEAQPAASDAKVVEAGQRALKAESELAALKLQLATSEKLVSENERRLADANVRITGLTQELSQKTTALAAAVAAPAPAAAPVLTPPVLTDPSVPRLQNLVDDLQAENKNLKDSLERAQAAAVTAVSSSAGGDADGAYQAARELSLMKEELELTRRERDKLKQDLDHSQLGKEDKLLSIASANWDLEQATRRYNEAEREIRRLGAQIEEDRGSCMKEKKGIESMLFDPRIAEKQQMAKIDELQKKADMANLALDLEKKRSKELSDKLTALGGTPPPSLAAMAASIPPSAGDSTSREFDDVTVSSVGVPAMPAVPALPVAQAALAKPTTPVIAVVPVIAPAPVPARANPVSDIAAADVPAAAAPVLPKLNIPAVQPAVVAAVAPSPAVAQMSADDLGKLLNAIGMADVSDVKKSSKGNYSWKAGSLFGTAEQSPISSPDAFDVMAQAYLEKTQSKCKGDFAIVPGLDQVTDTVHASTYQVACVSSSGDKISASVVFFARDGFFTTIAHEAPVDQIDTALDASEALFNRITGAKVASR